MSFSSEVKEELSKHPGKSRHCQIAELAALFVFDGKIEMTDSGCDMYLDSESEVVNRKYELLEQHLFQNRQSAQGVSEKQQKQRLYEMVKMWDEAKKIPVQADVVNGLLLQQSCCKKKWLWSAAFICQSVTRTKRIILRLCVGRWSRQHSFGIRSTAFLWMPRL